MNKGIGNEMKDEIDEIVLKEHDTTTSDINAFKITYGSRSMEFLCNHVKLFNGISVIEVEKDKNMIGMVVDAPFSVSFQNHVAYVKKYQVM